MIEVIKPPYWKRINHLHPLARGLVGYWAFNEGTGDKLNDLSGNGNHGTINGAAWTPGKDGHALSFNGSSDYAEIQNPNGFNVGSQMSVFLWLKGPPEVGGAHRGVLSRYSVSDNKRAWVINKVVSGSGNLIHVILSDDGTYAVGHKKQYQSAIVIFDNTWHFTGFTWNAGSLKLYVDGLEDTGVTKDYDDAITTIFNLDVSIGVACQMDLGSPIRHSEQIVSIACVYNRVLSAEEIKCLYREPYAMFR